MIHPAFLSTDVDTACHTPPCLTYYIKYEHVFDLSLKTIVYNIYERWIQKVKIKKGYTLWV